MEYPTVKIPATHNPEADIDNDLCANPECERQVGLAGVYVVGSGRICGHCFRNMKRTIVMDENYEMSAVWRK